MKRINIFIYIVTITIAPYLNIYSVPGELNSNFGTNGIVTHVINRADQALGCAVQSDGAIIVGGRGQGYYQCAGINRFTVNGVLDTSFNLTGSACFSFGSFAEARDIALQSDGKIIFTGCAVNDQSDIIVARLNIDGTLDNYIATEGYMGGRGNSILQQPDLKIVVGGYYVDSYARFALIRYNTDNSLDDSFGQGGMSVYSSATNDVLKQILLQPDGKIVAGGTSTDDSGNAMFMLARYNSDGSFDTTFGPNSGIVKISSGNFVDLRAIALQADGSIVAAGFVIDTDGILKFLTMRCDSDGNLDQSFGVGGIVITQLQFQAAANSLVIQSDGKILVGGYSVGNIATQFAIIRYNSDGSPDTTFGSDSDGTVFTAIGGTNSKSRITSLALQSNGDIIAAGYSGGSIALACYLGS